MKVLPMRLSPGRNDLLSHTLRHFVAVGADMDRLPPDNALTAHLARLHLIEAGADEQDIDAIPADHQALSPRWRGFTPTIVQIHDDGYGPRYRAQATRAGEPGQRGGWWRRQPQQGRRRWTLTRTHSNGARFRLAGDWVPARAELRMVTAYVERFEVRPRETPEDDYFATLCHQMKKKRR